MIVRRNRQTFAARQRMIVRRSLGIEPPDRPREPEGTRRRHFGLWLLGVLILGIVTFAGLSVLAWRLGTFTVGHVEVSGNDRLTAGLIADLAALDGDLILTADLGAATQRIQQHPLVRQANVERRWPNTVRITIEEREPWGVWEQAGVLYTIDRDGYVLGTFLPDPDAVVIRSTSSEPLHQGQRVDHQAIETAAEVYRLLPGQLGVGVREVAYVDGIGVQVTTETGQVALMGDSSSIPYKLAAWVAVAREAAEQGITYTLIDLRYGNRPVLIRGES